MKNEFIPYEEALALKELGFDEYCFGSFGIKHQTFTPSTMTAQDKTNTLGLMLAPLYQQAFKWFREKYQLHSTITSISQESWQWHITKPSESLGKMYEEDFYEYEEAELACLVKLIEIVNQNKEDEYNNRFNSIK